LKQHWKIVVSGKTNSYRLFCRAIDKIMIYDVAGSRVYLKTNVDSQELKVVDLVSSQQVLLVKVVLQDGKSITKKGDLLLISLHKKPIQSNVSE
jgi:hypothetical protein